MNGADEADLDAFRAFVGRRGVLPDWEDRRDLVYRPSLATLRARLHPHPCLFRETRGARAIAAARTPVFGIRDQGRSGRCAGFALAALLDIQRRLQAVPASDAVDDLDPAADARPGPEERVSAAMLYHMARYQELFEGGTAEPGGPPALVAPTTSGVRTLRAVIKGFYHNGVCPDLPAGSDPRGAAVPPSAWPSAPEVADRDLEGAESTRLPFPTVAQAKAARRITLGSYYRLKAVLNHYHAALNDAGAVLVAANVHDGWRAEAVAASGAIAWTRTPTAVGAHAFVLVGYEERGFLVLNSWGPEWGGYAGFAGIALWSYDDWAQNVIDGWVLRLGVPAPAAFHLSIGEQGRSGVHGRVRAGSTPCIALLGHFMHLDDGAHVTLGAYPTTPAVVGRTLRLLRRGGRRREAGEAPAPAPAPAGGRPEPRGVLLWIPGTLEGLEEAVERGVGQKAFAERNGLYYYTILWCCDFVEAAMDLLRGAFAKTRSRVGDELSLRDQLIEHSVRGMGRAFWRDVEAGARRAVWGTDEGAGVRNSRGLNGHLARFVRVLYRILDARRLKLHVVAEGAGVLVLDELVELLRRENRLSRFERVLGSLDLALPAIRVETARERVLPLVERLNARPVASGAVPPARVHLPSADLEARVRVGAYGKSILHFVANACMPRGLDDAHRPPPTLLGMARALEPLAGGVTGPPPGWIHVIDAPPDGVADPAAFEQAALTNHPRLMAAIRETVLARVDGH